MRFHLSSHRCGRLGSRLSPLLAVVLCSLLLQWPLRALALEPLPSRQLSLREVDALVSERNRPLAAARRATEAAEAGVEIAGARPNPVVSVNTTGIASRRTGTNDPADTTWRIDQPIERGGKRELRLAVAGSILDASRADAADSLRIQRLLAHQAYFDLKAAEEKSRIAAESAELARRVLAKAELRLSAGDISAADVARIRTDATRSASESTQAQIDLQRARQALARLLALDSEAGRLMTADPWPDLEDTLGGTSGIETRPDIVAARRRLEAAEKAIDLARSQRVRDITVGAQMERSTGNTFGFGVSIPLFTGNDYRGELRQAIVARDSANDELERIRAEAAAESAQIRTEAGLQQTRARQLLREALPAARKAHASVLFAFSHGAASALDVIDARRSLHAVEIDTTNALTDAAKARAAWSAVNNTPKEQP